MEKKMRGFSNDIGLFRSADKSKVLRNFIWFPILAYVLMMAGAIPAGIVGEILKMMELITPLGKFVIFDLALGFGLASVLIFLIVRYRERRSIADLGFTRYHAVRRGTIGFGLGLGMMALAVAIIMLLGGFTVVPNAKNVGMAVLPTVLFTLIGWIIQGSTEEILTRGWMLPLLGKKYSVPIAIGITSVFFMLIHSQNNGMTIVPIINLLLFGIFAAVYVVYTKELWGICALHAAWNWMQGNIVGVEVSGTSVPGGSLVKLQAQGHHLISGGRFGIEGSLVTTAVFAIAAIIIVVLIRRQKEAEIV